MGVEPGAIVVPADLTRAYKLAREHGRRAATLRALMDDRTVYSEICNDCVVIMEQKRDEADAVQFALVKAMDLKCPCRDNMITKQPRELSCEEVLNGRCSRCGNQILTEDEVQAINSKTSAVEQ